MVIEGKKYLIKKTKKNQSFVSSGEEAFRPEVVFNPYIQRMFQVCLFFLFFF